MKDFRLSVLDKNGELKEVSPEFLKPTKVDFDMSDIESYHPTPYLGVDLSMEMELDATGKSKKNKAYEEALKAFTAREKAWEALEATPEFKAYEKAWKAVEATPEYRDYLKACKAYDEAWKAKDEAEEGL